MITLKCTKCRRVWVLDARNPDLRGWKGTIKAPTCPSCNSGASHEPKINFFHEMLNDAGRRFERMLRT